METSGGGNGGGFAAPTGCYKCGRPGHWSRDCPSNPNSNPNPDPNSNSSSKGITNTSSHAFRTGGGGGFAKVGEKPKRLPRSRPKLTPDRLLSNDGLGYVLRHFPRSFKYRGRGNEVRDLGDLLGLYAEWNSHLLPYYSFDQFVHKVEQVGAAKSVRVCINELRERVANGGDPTKLHERPDQHEISNHEQEAMGLEQPSLFQEDTALQNHNTDDFQDDVLHEIYEKATEEPSQVLRDEVVAAVSSGHKELVNQVSGDITSSSNVIQISEEQRARIEANRLKALERAASRARPSQAA